MSTRGGMVFERGITARVSTPPTKLAVVSLRLTTVHRPQVKISDAVTAGQALTSPDQPSRARLASPIAASVGSITPWRHEGVERFDITLWPRAGDPPTALDLAPPQAADASSGQDADPDAWLHALRDLGPWPQPGLGGDLFSQLHAGRRHGVSRVICVGLDAFTPYPDRSSLLASFADEAAAGTRLIADLLDGARPMMLADRALEEYNVVRRVCRRHRIRLRARENVYPATSPTLLVRRYGRGARRDRMLPRGRNPATRGVVLVEPWHAIRLGRWLANGALDMARPYFVGWSQLRMPISARWALPGQPLSVLSEALVGTSRKLAHRAVIGDPMTGRHVTAPRDSRGEPMTAVTPTDAQLITMIAPPMQEEPDPCVHCGWCAEVCPTGLQPIDLVQLAQEKPAHPRLTNRLPWCIDCGLCTLACPSRIPLAQMLRDARYPQGAPEHGR